MKNKKLTAVLSSVIVVVLAIVVGFSGMLDGTVLTAAAENGISITTGYSTDNDTKFVVPEAIYLYPDGLSFKNSSSTPFQYYVNNKADGSVDTTTGTQGIIFFSDSNIKAGTNATISYKFLDSSFSNLEGGSISLSGSTITNGGSVSITAGSSPTLSSSTTGCFIQWTLKYTDSRDNAEKTITAYTYVYKPYVVPIAGGADAGYDSQKRFSGNMMWISGIHNIVENSSAGYGYIGKSTYNGSYFISSENKSYIGSTQKTTGKKVNEVLNIGSVSYATGASQDYVLFQGTTNSDSVNASFKDNKSATNYFNNSSGTNTFNVRNFYASTQKSNYDYCVYRVQVPSKGKIYIDTSRYTNFNQIPNLKIGFAVVDDDSCTDNTGDWYIADYTGRTASLPDSGNLTKYSGNNTRSKTDWGTVNQDYGSLIASQHNTTNSESSYNTNEGLRYAGNWPKSISSSINTYTLKGQYVNFYGSKRGIAGLSIIIINLDTVQNNKGNLRSLIYKAQKYMSNERYYTTTSYSNFINAYNKAYRCLATVDGGFNDTTYTSVDSAVNDLNSKISALQINTGKVTATHKYGEKGGTDTYESTYNYGNDVSISCVLKDGYSLNSSSVSPLNYSKVVSSTISANFVYTPIQYDIDISLNGGSASGNPSSYNIESSAITLINPTKTGYTFTGWTGSNGSTASTSVTIPTGSTGEKSYTANWMANTYTVKYNGNGNTGGSTAQSTHTYDIAKPLTANGFTKSYTVTLNPNGTSGSPATVQGKGNNANGSLTYNCSFAGWATSDSGSVAYNNNASVTNLTSTANGTVTLYAKWNGGSAVTLPAPTRNGYQFDGWYNAASGGSKVGGAGESYTPTASITLYAHWIAETKKVTVNPNGGSYNGSTGNTVSDYSYDSEVKLSTPVKTNYALSGWDVVGKFNQQGRDVVVNSPIGYSDGKQIDSTTITMYKADGTVTTDPAQASYTGYYVEGHSQYEHISLFGGYKLKDGDTVYVSFEYKNGNGQNPFRLYNGVMNNDYFGNKLLDSKEWKTVTSIKGKYGNGTFDGYYTIDPDDGKIYGCNTNGVITEKSLCYNDDNGAIAALCSFDSGATSNEVFIRNLTVMVVSEDGNSINFTMSNADTTFTAHWTQDAFDIDLDYCGYADGNKNLSGSVPDTKGTEKITGQKFNTALQTITPPTRTGYDFMGYYSEKNSYEDGKKFINADGTSNKPWDKQENGTLYARWKPHQYTINYYGNGFTGTKSGITLDSSKQFFTTTYTYDVSSTLAANDVYLREYTVTYDYANATGGNTVANSKSTYTLSKWNTKNDGSETDYNPSSTEKNRYSANGSSLNLFAKWSGGSVTLPTPTRTGYTFDGWYNDTTKIMGATFTPASDVTLTAHWNNNTTAVTFDGNKPSSATNKVKYNSAEVSDSNKLTATLTYDATPANVAGYTLTGWTFEGYYDATTGGTQYFDKDGKATKAWNKDVITTTLYAHWEANTYTVTLNGNGATTDGTGSVTATFDADMPTVATAPKREYTVKFDTNKGSGSTTPSPATYADLTAAYTFKGFFTATSDGIQYYNADLSSAKKWDKTANATLNAQWTAKGVTLPTAPTRDGYTFDGWYDGSNKISGSTYTPTAKVTLTAHWKANTYTITYNGNGNSGGSTAQSTHNYDVAKALTSNGFTKYGYTFNGWNTKADGSGTSYTNGQSVTNLAKSGNVDLFAKWTPTKYTITYNCAGGTAISQKEYYITGTDTLPTPVRTGYTFVNWSVTTAPTLEDGVATWSGTYSAGESVNNKYGNITLTANWTANVYTVKYDGNGSNSGSMANSTFTYDSSETLTANAFKRKYTVTLKYNDGAGKGVIKTSDGQPYATPDKDLTATYTFKKWTTNAAGTANERANGAVHNNLTTSGEITLYAQWEKDSVTLPTPEARYGYTFGGWYENEACTGTVYNGSYTPTKDVTFYAKWTKTTENYTIRFNENDGTNFNLLDNIPVDKRSDYKYSGGGLFHSDHRIYGYYASGDDIGTLSFSGDAVNGDDGDFRLFAYKVDWNADDYVFVTKNNIGNSYKKVYLMLSDASNNNEFLWHKFLDGGTTYTSPLAMKLSSGSYINYNSGSIGAKSNSYSGDSFYFKFFFDVKDESTDGNSIKVGLYHGIANQQFGVNPATVKVPTRTGYQFKGYWTKNGTTSGDWGTQYYNTDGTAKQVLHEENRDVTLYARWEKNGYTVTYNGNNATSGSMEKSSHYFDEDKALTSNAFSRSYVVSFDFNDSTLVKTRANGSTKYNTDSQSSTVFMSFKNWNTVANGSGTSYSNGQTVKNLTTALNGNVNLYAQWNNASFSLPAVADHPGYKFEGWYTSKTGGTRVGGSGETYSVALTTATTYYAHWTANTYEITFNEDNGTPYNLLDSIKGKSKHIHEHGDIYYGYNASGQFTITGQKKWDANEDYTDGAENGYSGYNNNVFKCSIANLNDYLLISTTGSNQNARLIAKITDGSKVAQDTFYNNGTLKLLNFNLSNSNIASENVTYYFDFDADKDISYNIAVNSALYHGIQCQYDATPKKVKAPSKVGYVFEGYFNDVTGDQYFGNTIDANGYVTAIGKWDISADTKLTAHWAPKPYKLDVNWTLTDKNGENVNVDNALNSGMAKVTVTDDHNYIKSANVDVGDFYQDVPNTYVWTMSASITDTSKYIFRTGNQTYATTETRSAAMGSSNHAEAFNIEPIYKIAFNANDVSSTSNPTGSMSLNGTYAYTQNVSIPQNGYALSGYTFKGWNTKADGTGISVANGATANKLLTGDPGSTVTLYAQWQAITYTVKFDENDGTTPFNIFNTNLSFGATRDTSDNRSGGVLDNRTLHFHYLAGESDGAGVLWIDGSSYSCHPGEDNKFGEVMQNLNYYIYEGSYIDDENDAEIYLRFLPETPTNGNQFYNVKIWDDGTPVSNLIIDTSNHTSNRMRFSFYVTATGSDTGYSEMLYAALYHGFKINYDSATINGKDKIVCPTRNGYKFIGYYTAAEGGEQIFTENGTLTRGKWDISSDTTLYAHWELAPFAITYDYGRVEREDGTVVEGKLPLDADNQEQTNIAEYKATTNNVTIKNPVIPGETFLGWTYTVTQNGSSWSQSSYQLEVKITDGKFGACPYVGGDVQMVANWKAKTMSVTFDENIPEKLSTNLFDVNYVADRVNYINFNVRSGGRVTVDGDHHAEKGYSTFMLYNLNGNSSNTGNTQCVKYVRYNGENASAANGAGDYLFNCSSYSGDRDDGYVIVGYLDSNGNTVDNKEYHITQQIINDHFCNYNAAQIKVQFYAPTINTLGTKRSQPDNYQFTMNLVHGLTGIQYGQKTINKVNVPTWDGFNFAGYWTKTADGDWDKMYFDKFGNFNSAELTSGWDNDGDNLGNVTLYAKWSGHEYTVHYDVNGAVNQNGTPLSAPVDQKFDYGDRHYLSSMNSAYNAITFDANGGKFGDKDKETINVQSSFLGWNTKPDGSGTTYGVNSKVQNLTLDSGINLYAMWGETEASVPANPTRTDTVGEKVIPMSFTGWYISPSSTTKAEIINNKVRFSGGTTLYAHWTSDTNVKIIFNENKSYKPNSDSADRIYPTNLFDLCDGYYYSQDGVDYTYNGASNKAAYTMGSLALRGTTDDRSPDANLFQDGKLNFMLNNVENLDDYIFEAENIDGVLNDTWLYFDMYGASNDDIVIRNRFVVNNIEDAGKYYQRTLSDPDAGADFRYAKHYAKTNPNVNFRIFVDTNNKKSLNAQYNIGLYHGITTKYGEFPKHITVPTNGEEAFTGYFTTPKDGGIQVFDKNGNYIGDSGWTTTADSQITLYARWSDAEYTITFEDNVKAPIVYTSGSTNIVLDNMGPKGGYDFVGWQVVSTDSYSSWELGKIYKAGFNVEGMYGNVTLRDIYEVPSALSFNITLPWFNDALETQETRADMPQEYYLNQLYFENGAQIATGSAIGGTTTVKYEGSYSFDNSISLDIIRGNIEAEKDNVITVDMNDINVYLIEGKQYNVSFTTNKNPNAGVDKQLFTLKLKSSDGKYYPITGVFTQQGDKKWAFTGTFYPASFSESEKRTGIYTLSLDSNCYSGDGTFEINDLLFRIPAEIIPGSEEEAKEVIYQTAGTSRYLPDPYCFGYYLTDWEGANAGSISGKKETGFTYSFGTSANASDSLNTAWKVNEYTVYYINQDDGTSSSTELKYSEFKYDENGQLMNFDGMGYKYDCVITYDWNDADEVDENGKPVATTKVDNKESLKQSETVPLTFKGWSRETQNTTQGSVDLENMATVNNDTFIYHKFPAKDDGSHGTEFENGYFVELYATWTQGLMPSELVQPTRLGYRFDGWFYETSEYITDKNGQTKLVITEHEAIEGETPVTSGMTLTAHWTKLELQQISAAYDFISALTFDLIDENQLQSKGGVLPDGGTVKIGKALKDGVAVGQATTEDPLVESGTSVTLSNGCKAEIDTSGVNAKLTLTTGDNFNSYERIYYSFQTESTYINGPIDIVPANNVYYEDKAFSLGDTITGGDVDGAAEWTRETDTSNGTETIYDGSAYGFNKEYSKNTYKDFSGDTYLKSTVAVTNQISQAAEYSFTATGFDLYSACGSDNAALMIYIWDSKKDVPVANAIVDTYASDSNAKQLVDGDILRQIPVYHFMTTERDTYTVQVYAVWLEENMNSGRSKVGASENGAEKEIIQQLRDKGLKVYEDTFEMKWMDDNSVLNGGSGADNVELVNNEVVELTTAGAENEVITEITETTTVADVTETETSTESVSEVISETEITETTTEAITEAAEETVSETEIEAETSTEESTVEDVEIERAEVGAVGDSYEAYAYIDGIRLYNMFDDSTVTVQEKDEETKELVDIERYNQYYYGYDSMYNENEKNAGFYNIRQFNRSMDEYMNETTLSDSNYGNPFNEIYLNDTDGSTGFIIDGFSREIIYDAVNNEYKLGEANCSVMVSMRAAKGDSAKAYVKGSITSDSATEITISGSTEMYYDLTDYVGEDGTLIIFGKDGADGYFAIGNIKVSGMEDDEEKDFSIRELNRSEVTRAMVSISQFNTENALPYEAPEYDRVIRRSIVANPQIVTFPIEDEKQTEDDDDHGGSEEPSSEPDSGETEEENKAVISIVHKGMFKSVEYKTNVVFYAEGKNVDGITWKVSGADFTVDKSNNSITVVKPRNTFTVTCNAEDADGKTLSDSQTITVNNGFFSKLKSLFNNYIFNGFKWKTLIQK